MNRVGKVKQRVRSRETIKQLAARNSDAMKVVQIVLRLRRILMEQAIAARQTMRSQLSLEVCDARLVARRIVRRRQ